MKLRMNRWTKTALMAICFCAALGGCERENEGNAPLTDEYFTFTMNNSNGALTSPPDSIGAVRYGDTTILFGSRATGGLDLYARFTGAAEGGKYTLDSMSIQAGNTHYVDSGLHLEAMVVQYGENGSYLMGRYTGTLKDTSTAYDVNGIFRLKRND